MIPPRWLLWALTSTRDHSYSAFPIMRGHMNSLPPFLSLACVAGTKWTQSCLHLSEMMGSDLQQKKGVERGRAHSSLLPRWPCFLISPSWVLHGTYTAHPCAHAVFPQRHSAYWSNACTHSACFARLPLSRCSRILQVSKQLNKWDAEYSIHSDHLFNTNNPDHRLSWLLTRDPLSRMRSNLPTSESL